jgi:hypothetical protein
MTSVLTSIRNFTSASVGAAAAFLLVGASSAYATPSTSELSFKISTGGSFSATNRFDSSATGCVVQLYGMVSFPDGSTDKVYLLATARATSKVVRFRAKNLAPVRHVNDGTGVSSVAQLNLQTLTSCNSGTLASATVARFLDCGKSKLKARTPTNFIRMLANKLREASRASANS